MTEIRDPSLSLRVTRCKVIQVNLNKEVFVGEEGGEGVGGDYLAVCVSISGYL
jgi:hypothetical protein